LHWWLARRAKAEGITRGRRTDRRGRSAKVRRNESSRSGRPVRVTRNADGSTTVNMGAKGKITQRMDMQARTMTLESSTGDRGRVRRHVDENVLQMGGGGGRQVVDMTDLKGNYQVALEISLADLMAMARAHGINVPAARRAAGCGQLTGLGGIRPRWRLDGFSHR